MVNSNYLKRMAEETSTDYWNDSCAADELRYAINNGAVGATTNPIIVGKVFNKEKSEWTDYINRLMKRDPLCSEVDILWDMNETMAVRGAEMLQPIFKEQQARKGRISIQVNPQFYKDAGAMLEQARHFHSLAENIQVKIPVTREGLKAIELATYYGVNVNATVSFSVPQAVMVGEAIEKGLDKRKKEGFETDSMTPVCTIMAGRADDWFKAICDKRDILVDPECLEWGGVAIVKRAYEIYKTKGYRAKLLIAAFRNHYHITEFVGGDIMATIPHNWQKKLNSMEMSIQDRIDKPVDSRILEMLIKKVPDFKDMYEPDGMQIEDFQRLGPQVLTLREFLQGYYNLIQAIREVTLTSPL